MKVMAGVNTAVTGIGALAGGGAIATGFIKQAKDKQIADLKDLLKQLEEMELKYPESDPTEEDIAAFEKSFAEALKNPKETIESDIERLNKESRALGDWRTGLMATNTATNAAGALIAGSNKTDDNLQRAIEACKASVKHLDNVRTQAMFDGTDVSKLTVAEKIIVGCGRWNDVDFSKIDNRAKGAMWSAIAGILLGGTGIVTSALANSDKVRDGDDRKAEKDLNTASNVLAIGTTAASTASTVFNAAQIVAIKRAEDAAIACGEALK